MSKSLKVATNEMLPETQEAVTEFYRLTALGVPKMEAYEQSGVSAATISVNKKPNPEQITALSEKGEALALREMMTNIDVQQVRFTRDAFSTSRKTAPTGIFVNWFSSRFQKSRPGNAVPAESNAPVCVPDRSVS